jgi:hypothetical protein
VDGGEGVKQPMFRINWMSPRFFYYAGLYVTIGGKRYRVLKVGPR